MQFLPVEVMTDRVDAGALFSPRYRKNAIAQHHETGAFPDLDGADLCKGRAKKSDADKRRFFRCGKTYQETAIPRIFAVT